MMKAKLVLSSGEAFSGQTPDWQKDSTHGEVVFTTGMTGYVESLTDPSYTEQILVFTYPLIGNYGVPPKDKWESHKIQAKGVVIANPSFHHSHHESEKSLLKWLEEEKVPCMYGVDTRALTKSIRVHGSMPGAILTMDQKPKAFYDPNQDHLVKRVSSKKITTYGSGKKTVIAVDCGMKENILRCLIKFGLKVIRVPHDYDYSHEDFDAIFLSNGPGNPAMALDTIQILQKALLRKKPTFGICLGSQVLAHAIGASTYKLKFGHRGHNQPVFDHALNRSILTSQNHGYAICENSLPKGWKTYFSNLNDGSIEGIIHEKDPFFAVQFHPESSPGPNDSHYLFNKFYELI